MAKNNPFSGAVYLLRGASLLKSPGLRRFVLMPLTINVLLFAGLTYLFFSSMNAFVATTVSSFPEWLQWLDWLFWILMVMAMLLFSYFTFTLAANFISAPFNGFLAEAIQRQHGSANTELEPTPLSISYVTTTFKEEFVKLTYSITRSVPFLILFLIPGINLIASALWLLFGSWIMAIQYTDYPFANNQILFKEQRNQLKERRWLVIGFGGAVMFGTMIPILNLIIVPSAVAGATLLYLENYTENEGGQ